jgi:hypothetical protein
VGLLLIMPGSLFVFYLFLSHILYYSSWFRLEMDVSAGVRDVGEDLGYSQSFSLVM